MNKRARARPSLRIESEDRFGTFDVVVVPFPYAASPKSADPRWSSPAEI
jgi:hypothetical protein